MHKLITGVAGLCLVAGSISSAAAQNEVVQSAMRDMLGTMSVVHSPTFREGQLTGCTVVFNTVAQDWTYKQGQFIAVTGSFGMMGAKTGVGALLKVVVNDIDPKTMKMTPSKPADAYFMAKNFETNKVDKVKNIDSDTPGAIFVMFRTDKTLDIIASGLAESKVTIAFARKPGGTNLQIQIDTSVEETKADGSRTRSLKTAEAFFACSEQLLNNAVAAAR